MSSRKVGTVQYAVKDVDPWPTSRGGDCIVMLAGGNHAVKAVNNQTGEQRSELCDNVNAAAAQRKREEDAKRGPPPRSPKEGAIKLF